MGEMRCFTLVRQSDESGVSGTGRVLDGVVFHNGKTVICWRTDIGDSHGYSSITLFDSFEAFEFIHIGSHPTNGSVIEWMDDAEDVKESSLGGFFNSGI